MVTVSVTNDLQFNLATPAGIVGQSPHKKQTKLDSIGNWTLTETLDGLKKFTFSAKNDEHEKANVLMERNISVPFLTPFNGIITSKQPGKSSVDFTAIEDAWHLSRKKFNCHDKRRIKYTKEDWHNKLWKQRRHIKIRGDNFHDLSTGSDFINVPLLFHTIDKELKVHARSDGNDILFTRTESDHTTTKLHHEIESFDPTTGELWAWIEFPEIRSGQDENFEMYFSNPDSVNQQTVNGTWSDYLGGFSMTNHLHKNSNDSSGNGFNGINTDITFDNGKIANAAKFNGVNSEINYSFGTQINNIWEDNGWFSCWINAKSDGENNSGIIADKNSWAIWVSDEFSGKVRINFKQNFSNPSNSGFWRTIIDIPINKNIKIDIVYDNSSPTNDPIFYINGAPRTVENGLLVARVRPTGTRTVDTVRSLILGNVPTGFFTFDGNIEEVRILKEPPENIAELIKIAYANELDPDNYFIIGQAERYIEQADIIAENILASANRDMPIISTTPIPDLIGLWRLDGDATDSKGTNNGTWTGTETYTEGVFNKAAIVGNGNKITLGQDQFSFTTENEFTLSARVSLPTNPTGDVIVLSKGTDTDRSTGYYLWWNRFGNSFEFTIFGGGRKYNVSAVDNTLRDGKFHNITARKKSGISGEMSIFIDGNKIASRTTTLRNFVNSENLVIGGYTITSTRSRNLFLVDDVRVYKRALTDNQIDKLSKMTQSDLDIVQRMVQWKLGDGHVTEIDNLISLWKFDQSLVDTKSSNDAVITSGTETYVDGKFGKALSFKDDTTCFVTAETSIDDIFAGGGSISGWVNITSNLPGTIFSKRDSGLGWLLQTETNGDNVKLVFAQDFQGVVRQAKWETEIPINTDTHILVTYNNSSPANDPIFYINGAPRSLTETIAPGTTAATDHPSNFIIGNNGRPLNGWVDDVRMYGDILTQVEAKRLYEQTDSGIDRVRDDNIPTRLLEIDFNHKNHLECLKKISKELSVNLYFNSGEYTAFIRPKGKTITPLFNKSELSKPDFSLKNVSNVINVLGSTKDGVQREKTFEETNELKYNYEETFADNQIATDETLDLIGTNIVGQLKNLEPDLTITTTPDQYNRFDIQTGDKLNISELNQDLQGTFRVIKISLTESKVKLSLSKHTNTTIQTAGRDISSLLSGIIRQIQDITITPE